MSVRLDGTRDESQPVEGFGRLYQVYQILVEEPEEKDLIEQLKHMDAESLCLLGSLSRSTHVLKKLYASSSSKKNQLLVELANNISTPPELLREMSFSLSSDVLIAVAKNPSTPSNTLDRLSKHDRAHVRRVVTGNPSLSINSLQELLSDQNPLVVSDALTVLRNRDDSALHGIPLSWIRKILK